MSTNGKIRIKLGSVEIEYEGSEAFIKEELTALIQSVSELSGPEAHASPTTTATPLLPSPEMVGADEGQLIKLAPNSIAAKLGVKGSSDLALVGAVWLRLARGRETFKRNEILEAMKSATSYMNKSHAGNLTRALETLLKAGKLNEVSSGTYALSAMQEQNARAQLA